MAWELTGNAGIDPNINFLGTTQAQPLIIKTNGTEAIRVTPDGRVGIGTATPNYSLSLFKSSGTNYLEIVSGARNTNGGWFGTDGADLVIQPKSGSKVVFYPSTGGGGTPLMVVQNDGKVGIGNSNPEFKLEVTAPNQGGIAIQGPNSGVGAGLQLQSIGPGGTGGRSWELLATGATSAQGAGKFNIRDLGSARDDFTITSDGNIGVGTTAPSAKLEVNGDVRVTGDIFLTNADCAEDFDIAEAEKIEPGTVMVINQEGALQQSEQAYDKRVAGVISGAGAYQSGLVLDRQQSQHNRLPVALVGKVYCKVDAGYAPIEVGDLLTTSPTLGHAMKASDPLRAFGSVIGKALRPLLSGQGLIPILIALQ